MVTNLVTAVALVEAVATRAATARAASSDPANPSSANVSPADASPAESGLAESGLARASLRDVGSADKGPARVISGQGDPAGASPREVVSADLGPARVSSGEAGRAESVLGGVSPAGAGSAEGEPVGVDPAELLDALVVLRRAQSELAALEPELVAAARAAGVSWQELAPALGVGSRQAAERRFLRSLPAASDTRQDDRVRAERDRRAGQRAVDRWANEHTVDLRRLAAQVTALTDLGAAAAPDVGRLHEALGATDATDLPHLLTETVRHLDAHPDLATRIDEMSADTDRVRKETQRHRNSR